MFNGYQNYSGFDLLWRRITAGLLCGGLTLGLTYPFEVFSTRLMADMTPKVKTRT